MTSYKVQVLILHEAQIVTNLNLSTTYLMQKIDLTEQVKKNPSSIIVKNNKKKIDNDRGGYGR